MASLQTWSPCQTHPVSVQATHSQDPHSPLPHPLLLMNRLKERMVLDMMRERMVLDTMKEKMVLDTMTVTTVLEC